MKFVNTSKKVIGIGGIYVLPDGSVELTDEMANMQTLKTYVRLGLGVLEKGETEYRKEIEAKLRAEMDAKTVSEKKDAEVKAGNVEDAPAEQIETAEKKKRKTAK